MSIRKLPAVLFFLVFSAASYSQDSSILGNDEGPLSISWEAVEGAASYRLEIRRDGGVFIDTETKENELKLDLAPGAYEYRIHVLNPFGGEASISPWQLLQVERAHIPWFRVIHPITAWEGNETLEMGLDIVDIKDDVSFHLLRDGRDAPVENRLREGTRIAIVNTSGLDPGKWDLVATTPSGLTFTHPEALTIRPTRPPEVSSLDTREVPNEGLIPVIISGNAFDDAMTVAFKGRGGYLKVATVEVSEGNQALAYLDLDGASAGSYDLIVTNPAGEETRKDNVLNVVEPEKVIKPRVQPRFEIQLGWAPMMMNTPIEDVPGLATFEFAMAFHSGWTKPFINGFGLEARTLFGLSGPSDQSDQSMQSILSIDVSGYWRPPVRGKVSPVLILGFGNMWSGYAEYFGYPNMLFVRTGIGMDFSTFSRFTRIGITAAYGYIDSETIPMLSLMFRRGFRF